MAATDMLHNFVPSDLRIITCLAMQLLYCSDPSATDRLMSDIMMRQHLFWCLYSSIDT